MPLEVLKEPAINTQPLAGSSTQCPVCNDEHRIYISVVRGLPICRCAGCGLALLHPQPSRNDITAFYGKSLEGSEPGVISSDSATEREAARRYVDALKRRGVQGGRMLLIAPAGHPLAAEASTAGFNCEAHFSIRELETGEELKGSFDAVVVCHQLEKAANPAEIVRRLRTALKPSGVLLVTTPSVESWPHDFFGYHWTEWRPENRFYFSPATIQSLLLRNGFGQVWVTPDRRQYTLRHIFGRASAMPRMLLTRLIILLFHLTPPPFRDMRLRFSCSNIIVTATCAEQRERPLCSIIVPAYNERDTFPSLMKLLLAKQIPGVDKEIIIVESNSKDGTRELATEFQKDQRVKVILQDRPRGKGNAVRAGLEQARGDIVLIQDADMEYDINDYDALIEPLLNYRTAFVLGSRHSGNWKMREFNDSGALSTYFNLGHIFFTEMINVLYGQRLKDPFTMYKVFRRDCLYGLELECNRFDFDFELLIKLVRKGYTPLELPVNYHSRSFSEGKKVRMIRDPLTWIWVSLKYKFTRLSKLPH